MNKWINNLMNEWTFEWQMRERWMTNARTANDGDEWLICWFIDSLVSWFIISRKCDVSNSNVEFFNSWTLYFKMFHSLMFRSVGFPISWYADFSTSWFLDFLNSGFLDFSKSRFIEFSSSAHKKHNQQITDVDADEYEGSRQREPIPHQGRRI